MKYEAATPSASTCAKAASAAPAVCGLLNALRAACPKVRGRFVVGLAHERAVEGEVRGQGRIRRVHDEAGPLEQHETVRARAREAYCVVLL